MAGKVGYDAVGLIGLGTDLLLVNRGWFASYGQRNPLPATDWVDGEVSLTGRLVMVQANPYQLGTDVYTDQYPQLVQAILPPELAVHLKASLQGTLLPWVLMLDQPGDATLTPHWRASTMTDAKAFGLCVAMVWPCLNPYHFIYLSRILFTLRC